MQFCKDCGTVLNLFGNSERELCSSCIQHQKKLIPPATQAESTEPTQKKTDSFGILADTILSYEKDKMVLRSKEGWELWSGAANSQSDLKTILARASRIYEIRLRRQKN